MMEVWISLCIVLIVNMKFTTGIPEADFFPFGLENGDTELPANDDDSSPEVPVSTLLPFFNHQHRSLWVNNNGIISLTRSVRTFTPSPFPVLNARWIVPFWADVDTRKGGSLFYRESVNRTLLDKATRELRNSGATAKLERFQALWMFIATWKDVAFYGADGVGKQKRNTFQAIVVTNGRHSFTIFNYGRIEWTTGTASRGHASTGLGGMPAQVGFNDGDGSNYFSVNGSLTERIINLPTMTNCGIPGKFVFQIDGAAIQGSGCNSNGSLTVVPRLGSMLGGEVITVSGPCFERNVDNSPNQIVAKVTFQKGIHKEQVDCQYLNDYAARCITPTLFTSGHVEVQLKRVDEQANNVIFKGHYSYENIARYSPKLERMQPDHWTFKYKRTNHHEKLKLRWDAREVKDILGCETGRLDLFAINERETPPQLLPLSEEFSYTVININTGYHDLKESNANLGNYKAGVIRMACSEEYIIKNVKAVWSDVHSLIWVVPVSLENVNSFCDAWLSTEEQKDPYADTIGHCPCTADAAVLDIGRYHPDPLCHSESDRPGNCYYHHGAAHCVKSNRPAEGGLNGGEHCCYDANGDLLETDVDIPTGKRKAGRTSCYHYLGKEPFDQPGTYPFISNFLGDEIPYQYCCEFTMQGESYGARCKEYLRLRPTRTDCKLYEPPPPARGTGEPHLVTLDGTRYTFNGLGEYTMVESFNQTFVMQVRTEQARDTNGRLQPASIFTAIAMKGNNTDLVQVQLNEITVSEILINGERQSFDFHSYQEFNGVSIRSTNGTKVLVVFTTLFFGVRLDIGNDLMNVMVTGARTMKNNTRGLLGVWNGNASDDFMYPNGTTLHHDAAAKQIHAFGESWRVEASDSLFTYSPGKDYDFYNSQSRREFEPTFVDELLSSKIVTAEQRSICGNSSECLYDLITTNNTKIAKSTKQAEDTFNEAVQTLEQVSEIVRCPPLPITNIANGRGEIQLDGHKPGDNVTFICHPGYELVGHNRSTCNGTGSWSPISAPSCNRKHCGPPPFNANSSVNSTSWVYQGVATYSCHAGFDQSGGNLTRICDTDGTWTGAAIECSRKKCGPPPFDVNSSVSSTSQEYEGVATYSCEVGFQQSGGNITRLCGTDGNWTGNLLECSRKKCSRPTANANSTVTTTSEMYEGVATYSCNDGFEQSGGNVTRICDADARWNGNPVECSRKKCGAPQLNANSSASSTSQEYEGLATYWCNAGFEHSGGNVTRFCGTDGKWTGTPVTCSRKKCGDPNINPNSMATSTSQEYEGVATYSCDDGYEQSGGNVTRVCDDDAQWAGIPIKCSRKKCGPPPFEVNSSVSSTSQEYEGVATYSCDVGFQQSGGNITRFCDTNGKWTGNLLACSRKKCSRPTANANSKVTTTSVMYEGVATYSCDDGYEQSGGNVTRICDADARWNGNPVECSRKKCGAPPLNANSSASSTSQEYEGLAIYSCHAGFKQSGGNVTRFCGTDGKWTGIPVTCSRKTCGDPNINPNSMVTSTSHEYEGVASYSCDAGYEQSGGNVTRFCDVGAQWTGNPMECSRKKCGPPSANTNSSVRSTSQEYEGVATYWCDTGFEMSGGNVKRICSSEGIWTGNPLECSRTTSRVNITMRLSLEYKANYKNLSDPITQLLLKDLYTALIQRYSKAIKHFKDIRITHLRNGSLIVDLQLLLTGNLTSHDKMKATVQAVDATFVDNSSFVVGNQLVLVTYAGNYLTTGIDCSKPRGEDINAIRTGSSFTYGYALTYNCKPGYEKKSGEATLKCLSDAAWNGLPLQCQNVDECSIGLYNCHPDALCRDTDGSYSCTCRNGYMGNGTFCSEHQPTKSHFAYIMGGISAALVLLIVFVAVIGVRLCRKRKSPPNDRSRSDQSKTCVSNSMVLPNSKANLPSEDELLGNLYYQRYILPWNNPRDPEARQKRQHVPAPKYQHAAISGLQVTAQNKLWRTSDFPSAFVVTRP